MRCAALGNDQEKKNQKAKQEPALVQTPGAAVRTCCPTGGAAAPAVCLVKDIAFSGSEARPLGNGARWGSQAKGQGAIAGADERVRRLVRGACVWGTLRTAQPLPLRRPCYLLGQRPRLALLLFCLRPAPAGQPLRRV